MSGRATTVWPSTCSGDNPIFINQIYGISNVLRESGQKESVRTLFACVLAAGFALAAVPAAAQTDLDPGNLTFKDFGIQDQGASFSKVESTFGNNSANPPPAKLVGVDAAKGMARVRFDAIKYELGLPLGWQASEDWERGVATSADKKFRVIAWRVDFAYEGVRDAEHYAATKAGSITARRPGIKAQARKLKDGSFLVIYENAPAGPGDGGEKRVVFDLVMSKPGNPKEGALLTLGVPASDADRGLKLMALLKQNIRVDW